MRAHDSFASLDTAQAVAGDQQSEEAQKHDSIGHALLVQLRKELLEHSMSLAAEFVSHVRQELFAAQMPVAVKSGYCVLAAEADQGLGQHRRNENECFGHDESATYEPRCEALSAATELTDHLQQFLAHLQGIQTRLSSEAVAECC